MKRRALLVGGILVVLLVAAAFVWLAAELAAIDRLEPLAETIHPGMTEAEVEALLDKPRFRTTFPEDGTTTSKWVTDRLVVTVRFDPQGRVTYKVVERIPLWDRIQELQK